VLAEALIGAAPALVPRYANAGGERPGDPGAEDLVACDLLLPGDKGCITGGAHADVVWEDHGPIDVVVSVDGVHSIEQRELEAEAERVGLVPVVHVGPVGGSPTGAFGAAATATEQRSQVVGRDVGGRGQIVVRDLGHL